MNLKTFVVCVSGLVAGVAGTALVVPAFSQGGQNEMDPQAMMQAWIKANAPGTEHAKLLKHMAGEWDCVATMWPAPGAPEMTSNATSTMVPMFGGRFVEQTYSGDWMGQPFTGKGFFGYDNAKKEFQAVWFDSGSTGMMWMTGKANADGSMEWSGPMKDPMTGENKTMRIHQVSGEGTMTSTFFETGSAGVETKTMQLAYTRKGGAGKGDPMQQMEEKKKQLENDLRNKLPGGR